MPRKKRAGGHLAQSLTPTPCPSLAGRGISARLGDGGECRMASLAERDERKRWSMARVVIASSAGTAFEWYDFFIFGSLAPVISRVFFAGLDPTPALIAALGLFAAE